MQGPRRPRRAEGALKGMPSSFLAAEAYGDKARPQLVEQPGLSQRCIEGGCAGACGGAFARAEAIGRVERRAVIAGGNRQAAGIDEPARERLAGSERQHAVPKGAANRAFGSNEVGGTRGVEQILIGGGDALPIVAVEQGFGSLTPQDKVEFH